MCSDVAVIVFGIGLLVYYTLSENLEVYIVTGDKVGGNSGENLRRDKHK
jgi:hypothetical protein